MDCSHRREVKLNSSRPFSGLPLPLISPHFLHALPPPHTVSQAFCAEGVKRISEMSITLPPIFSTTAKRPERSLVAAASNFPSVPAGELSSRNSGCYYTILLFHRLITYPMWSRRRERGSRSRARAPRPCSDSGGSLDMMALQFDVCCAVDVCQPSLFRLHSPMHC